MSGKPSFSRGYEANVNGTMGMTLRDYFAGQALAMSQPDQPKALAEWAYRVADAMLTERSKATKETGDA